MKVKLIILVFILLGLLLPLNGCKEVIPGYIVFIDEDGCCGKGMDGNPIVTMWVFPGDKVIWINTSSNPVTVEFENTGVFGIDKFEIPAGSRSISTVQKHASGSFDYMITPCNDKTDPSRINILNGTPKGNIGDQP
jgi:hypothetical protein